MSKDENQLFVGRLPRGSRSSELEDVFYKYGKMTRCDVKQGIKMAYGFLEFEDRRDAEDALRGEHGRDFNGARIVVEWARGPKDTSAGRDNRERGFRENKYRDDDRKDYRRDDRHGRHERRSRSPYNSRRRSPSKSPDFDSHRGKRSRSRSPDYNRRSRS